MIPVRTIGPGTQPAEEYGPEFFEMPRGMNTFAMPHVPGDADARAMAECRAVLAEFLARLRGWDPGSWLPGPRSDLAGASPGALTLLNQMLGEGEVSVRVRGARELRIQESVFAGVWRVCEVAPDGRVVADWIEAGSLPGVARDATQTLPPPDFRGLALPPGAMNSPALLAEIKARFRARRAGQPAHVINLTLLPLNPADREALELALPAGPVAMLSRGFGNCHISSTAVRAVWRVRYFNNAQTLILDTIEVVDVPEEAAAAREDLEDSGERLAELVDWMAAPAG